VVGAVAADLAAAAHQLPAAPAIQALLSSAAPAQQLLAAYLESHVCPVADGVLAQLPGMVEQFEVPASPVRQAGGRGMESKRGGGGGGSTAREGVVNLTSRGLLMQQSSSSYLRLAAIIGEGV
jgi:hypothetical protein